VSNKIEIRVPDIGDFSDIPVIEILVSVGDQVKMEDSLITLESDKATMEVPSPAAGVIREMKLKLDDTVSEGDIVAAATSGTGPGTIQSACDSTTHRRGKAGNAGASGLRCSGGRSGQCALRQPGHPAFRPRIGS